MKFMPHLRDTKKLRQILIGKRKSGRYSRCSKRMVLPSILVMEDGQPLNLTYGKSIHFNWQQSQYFTEAVATKLLFFHIFLFIVKRNKIRFSFLPYCSKIITCKNKENGRK